MVWVGTARAPAKINLTLHIESRRMDGYHELASLVAFAGIGDEVSLTESAELSLFVSGPRAAEAGPVEHNHVLRAARALQAARPGLRTGAFHLVKRLPVAAGLGGGSADAAAALRLLARLNGLSMDEAIFREVALATGADVPVCLDRRARMMRGIGERLDVPLKFPRLHAVLVNPGKAASTPAVFAAIGLEAGERVKARQHSQPAEDMSRAAVLALLNEGRNDMQQAAIELVPEIGDAIDVLSGHRECRLIRMTGSGATVFGVFDDCVATADAARRIRAAQPEWWVKPTVIG